MVSDMTLMPQHSYSRGPTDVPLLNETIGERLRKTAALHPDREALVVRHQEYVATYSELDREIDHAARGLLALGVEHGDRVAIWASNRYEWVVTQFATARIGAVLVTINPAYRSHELRYALQKSGACMLLMAEGFRDADYVAILDEVRDELPLLREVIVVDRHWHWLLAAGGSVPGAQLAAREASLDHHDQKFQMREIAIAELR
jgi:fatty-acyl-CoA synthase